MTKTFDTMKDVEKYIIDALGDFAADYRISDMASERTQWDDGKLVFDFEGTDFYEVAKLYEKERPNTVKLSNELLQVSHDLQGVAVAVMHLGGDIETNGSGLSGTGWLCELLGDKLIESSKKLEGIIDAL